jgi:hypothetical protein
MEENPLTCYLAEAEGSVVDHLRVTILPAHVLSLPKTLIKKMTATSHSQTDGRACRPQVQPRCDSPLHFLVNDLKQNPGNHSEETAT